ncbi:MAG TPA: peptidyl-prolyl cis-trans isomerase [Smithella sp.]|nr:peptidyl-prolyl cis-trans isomerase [Smithella sp.]
MIPARQRSAFFSIAVKSGRGRLLRRCGMACLFFCSLIVACDQINNFSRPYVATVNGSKIYLDDYQALLGKKMQMVSKDLLSQPDYMQRFEEEVLDGMIAEKIMELRATELNISVSNAELEEKIKEIRRDYGEDFTGLFAQENINYDKWKEKFKKEILLQKLISADVNSKIKISEAEIRDYFEKHRHTFKSDLSVRVSQIVVRDMSTAERALERLRSGEEFAKVASEVSISPEAGKGGDLGFITRWMMPEPLDKTIFEIPVNQISPIVQSSYGFHIFKVMEIHPAREKSLSDVREDIVADIRLQKEESAFAEWLDALKKKAVIKKETNMKIKRPYQKK